MAKVDRFKALMGGNIGESVGANRQSAAEAGVAALPPPPAANDDWELNTKKSGKTRLIDLTLIDADPDQPRKKFDSAELTSLAASLAEDKLIQAIVVRPGPTPGRFTIVAGERRFRAMMMLLASGADDVETTIRAEVRTDLTAARVKEIQVLENLLRSDLRPAEEAAAFHEMMTAKDSRYPTAVSLANKLKVSEGTISRSLSLLALPEWVRPLILKKSPEQKGEASPTMTPTQAYEVTKAPPEMHDELCRRVLADGLTVAQIGDIVAGKKEAARVAVAEPEVAPRPAAPALAIGTDRQEQPTEEQGAEPEASPDSPPAVEPKIAAKPKRGTVACRVFEPGDGLTITARRKAGIELAKLAEALEAALLEVRAELVVADQTGETSIAAA